jgi:hypothetical protein
VEFLEYERENEVVWARNDFVERMLGRKPRTVRDWLQEHARLLLARGSDDDSAGRTRLRHRRPDPRPARELVLKRGVKGLTIAEIAEKAHVGKGTAYLYWKTKEDLLLAVITTNHEKTEEMT